LDEKKSTFIPVSFDDKPLREYCDALKYARENALEFPNGDRIQPTSPRNRFVLTVILLPEQISGCAGLVLNGMAQSELKHYLH
jgi:hypothetical protein